MVENLNPRTFAAYGQVFEDNALYFAQRTAEEWQECILLVPTDNPGSFVCCPDATIGLDYDGGMVALCVYAQDSGQTSAYYLDKPVQLAPGTPFQLLPIDQRCTVRLYLIRGTALQPADVPGTPPPLSIDPSFHIPRIHTLFYQEKPKGFYFRGEKHAPYELTFVDQGRVQCIMGGINYTLERHDLLFCPPNQWHIQYADPDVSAAFVTVSFELEGIDMSALAGRVHHAPPEVIKGLSAMLAEQKSPRAYSADHIILHLSQVLLSLLGASETTHQARHDPIAEGNENRLVDKGLRYIEEHLTRPLTVAEIAAAVCVSPSYLAVLFRRQLHMTPIETIRKLKLEEGRRLIHQGDMTISQVAQHLGFATLQHFSRCFKQYFGLGPREYARSLRSV